MGETIGCVSWIMVCGEGWSGSVFSEAGAHELVNSECKTQRRRPDLRKYSMLPNKGTQVSSKGLLRRGSVTPQKDLRELTGVALNPDRSISPRARENPLPTEISVSFSTSNWDLISSKMSKGREAESSQKQNCCGLGGSRTHRKGRRGSLHGARMAWGME